MALLTGKIAIVSGSSRGIGKEIARQLLRQGAVVYITGRSNDAVNQTCSEFSNEFSTRVQDFRGDLTDPVIIKQLLNLIMKNHKRIDILVANIGSGRYKMGWDVEDEIWQEAFDKNFFGAVRLSQETIRHMVRQQSGSIVFISSIAGVEPIPAPVPYSAAKAALLHYMKCMATLLGPEGVRINAVSPGNIFFQGGTWDQKMLSDAKGVESYIQNNVPLRKLGTPLDIADAVCYLSSDNASFITGANLIIDGGQTRGI